MEPAPRTLCLDLALDPRGLSCDATQVFVQTLASAARALGPEQWAADPLHETWRERAAELAAEGALPLPPGFQPARQIERLAAALHAPDFRLRVWAPAFPDHLERAIQWFERHAKVAVERILPGPPAPAPEVFKSILAADQPVSPGWSFSMATLAGQPHPASPGEQRLHARLEADPELRGLFVYNLTVESRSGRKYCVDLLQPELRCIVEVDGYRHHHSRPMFFSDRHRDYELLVSGYFTLRIDHDEVMRDLESAVGKIRDLVHYRRGILA
jgi:hypothetical protein